MYFELSIYEIVFNFPHIQIRGHKSFLEYFSNTYCDSMRWPNWPYNSTLLRYSRWPDITSKWGCLRVYFRSMATIHQSFGPWCSPNIITLQCCILAHTFLLSPAYVSLWPTVRQILANCTSRYGPVAMPTNGLHPSTTPDPVHEPNVILVGKSLKRWKTNRN